MFVIDNQSVTTLKTPKSEREKYGLGDIYSNAAKCLNCDIIVRSVSVGQAAQCGCMGLRVSGGTHCQLVEPLGVEWECLIELYYDARTH